MNTKPNPLASTVANVQGSYNPNPFGSAGTVIGGLKSQGDIHPPADVIVHVLADCSGSMSGSKTTEANAALKALFTACADPITKDAIRINVITFSDSGTLIHQNQSPQAMLQMGDIVYGGGGTCLADSLAIVQNEIKSYSPRPERKALKPFIIILSDGCVGDVTKSLQAANTLKNQAYIVTIGFGNDADEHFLQQLATTPQHYSKSNIGGLSKVMESIGKSVSRYSVIK